MKHKLSNLQGAMTKKENDWRQRVNDLLREIEQLKTRVDNQQQLPPGHQHSNNRDNVPFQPQPTAETCTSITTMPNGRSNPYQSGSRIRDHDLDLDLDINLNRANSSRTRLMSRSGSEPLSALDRKTVHTFPMSQGVSKTASRRHSFAAPGPSREGAILTATHTATGSRPGTGTGTGTGTTVPAPISFHHSTQHAVLSSRQTMQHRIHSTTPGTMNSRYNNQRNERRRYRSRDVVGLKRSKSMPYSRR